MPLKQVLKTMWFLGTENCNLWPGVCSVQANREFFPGTEGLEISLYLFSDISAVLWFYDHSHTEVAVFGIDRLINLNDIQVSLVHE
jgi:hypothetical protein